MNSFFICESGQKQDHFETIVFIHGLFGWSANWKPILKFFESDFHVITYDQRGHGRSNHPQTGYAFEDFAEDLDQILRKLKVPRAHLVGHSLGARVAQCFAAEFPGKTLSLVFEDMGPQSEPDSTLATQQMLLSVPVPFSCGKERDQFFKYSFHLKTDIEDIQRQVMVNFLKANLRKNSEGLIDWRFSLNGALEALNHGLTPRWTEYRSLNVPTLVLRGECSKHFSQETYELMLNSLSKAQGQIITHAGHWIHSQKPEIFSRHILDFLKTLKNSLFL